MSDKKIILAGYSGHGFVVAEAALTNGLEVKYYSEFEEVSPNPFGLQYLGFEGADFFSGWENDHNFILGIGDNKIRMKVAALITSKGREIYNVIHNSSSIGQKVIIGDGNFIARNVSVNSLAEIGNYCILNTACIIEHECNLSNGVHIGPGAVLAGNVFVDENTFVGANAVVKQGVRIGKNNIIGAGSVILKDIHDNEVWVGNPAKRIK